MEKVRIICDSSVISEEAAGYVIENYEPPCEMEQRGNGMGNQGSKGAGSNEGDGGCGNRRWTELGRENQDWEYQGQENPYQENTSREITEQLLAQAIEQAGGSKTKAARILGIHRSTIWRYIKKFGMK